jgi:hypothetical protein
VYVDHTGDLTWVQKAWCGVLSLWPAALCHESLRCPDCPDDRQRYTGVT